ncbi:hypothetical protein VNO77_21817 [Canavalia gladiata]|uniref:Uncharacterized protein n=1 Tax=Canavalia gladiata TaxID=3824 RepID=A0AAN9L6M1_CANGL
MGLNLIGSSTVAMAFIIGVVDAQIIMLVTGHTIDRCYKIHEYLPNRPKSKFKSSTTIPSVNQVSITLSDRTSFFSFITDQCQMLISLLSSKMVDASKPLDHTDLGTGHVLTTSSLSFFTNNFFNHFWILDSEASKHITYNVSFFTHYLRFMTFFIFPPLILT